VLVTTGTRNKEPIFRQNLFAIGGNSSAKIHRNAVISSALAQKVGDGLAPLVPARDAALIRMPGDRLLIFNPLRVPVNE